MKVEDQFAELAVEVSQKAAAIQCKPQEYIDGLRGIAEQCETDIAAAKETMEEEEEEEEE
jgi:hypothetical protein